MSQPETRRLPLMLVATPAVACLIAAGAFLCQLSFLENKAMDRLDDARQEIDQVVADVNTERARVESLTDQVAQAEHSLQRAQPQATLARRQAEQLDRRREETDRLRRRLQELEQRLAEIQETARQEMLRHSALHSLRASEAELRTRLARAVAERERLAAEVAAAQRKAQSQAKQYAVTALAGGGSGSIRPATFLECERRGIIVQPEGKLLSSAQTESDRHAFQAAVRRTRYAVFLIRPDGYDSFRRYRALLLADRLQGDEPVEVGFEPVNADWILEYPSANPATRIRP